MTVPIGKQIDRKYSTLTDYEDSLAGKSTIELVLFLFSDFISWWYIKTPMLYFRYIKRIYTIFDDKLSVTLLFKTFGVPLYRINTLTGEILGILGRIVLALISALIIIPISIIYVLLMILWLLLPPGAIFMIVFTLFKN